MSKSESIAAELPNMSLAEVRDHDATLRALAEDEREDAARELPPPVDPLADLLIQPGGAWHHHKWPARKAPRPDPAIPTPATKPPTVRSQTPPLRLILMIPTPYGSSAKRARRSRE